MTINPSLFSSDSREWETPDDLWDQLNAEFAFDWDCAATAKNSMVDHRYYGPDHTDLSLRDALDPQLPWVQFRRGWINPPYGRGIGKWIRRAAEAVQGANGPRTMVVLVPVRPDTQWWCRWAVQADEIRYLEGRLTFVGAPSAAPFPSALLIFRRRFDAPYKWHY